MALESVARVDHYDPDPHASHPNQNLTPHWPANRTFGAAISTVQSIVIHETSGSPSYAAVETFVGRYTCMVDPDVNAEEANLKGVGPQFFIEPNGTAFSLISNQNLTGQPRETWHAGWITENIGLNSFTVGIENGDIGDSSVTPGNGTGPWWALSSQAEDLTGMKAYLVLLPRGQEDAVLIWIARFPQEWVWVPPPPPPPPPAKPPKGHWELRAAGINPGFQGTGQITDGRTPATTRHMPFAAWRNMLFTERNFRSLALLCRLLAEQYGLPRNFPLLPYASADPDWSKAPIFRKLILAEQRRDDLATQVGSTTADIEGNTATFTQQYAAHPSKMWSRFFGSDPSAGARAVLPCYRGILAHSADGAHPCPGPLFDWYRFAREVWDWWWYPFDLGADGAASTTMRPYFQARHDTPLLEYYYDAPGGAAAYAKLRELVTTEVTYTLPLATPVYALANGVVVAAQLPGDPVGASGFLLVRHEVFYHATNNRIDYDHAPTFVWSLTEFLGGPRAVIPAAPPALPAAIPTDIPTWLHRFIIRLRETELAVQFHTAHAATNAALRTGWAHAPSSPGPRGTAGQEIERDAAAYRTIADDLNAGKVARFPLEATTDTTPVRICLGDFVGYPNVMASGRNGIQIEIFSKEQLPVPNAAQRAVSASTGSWWKDVTGATRHETVVEADLPADGVAWHYDPLDFLTWINTITWGSEWIKYGVTGADGNPAPAPARPISRIVT